jgi:hypothetical protein
MCLRRDVKEGTTYCLIEAVPEIDLSRRDAIGPLLVAQYRMNVRKGAQ